MQRIRFVFQVRVRKNLVSDGDFAAEIEEALYEVPGVEYVSAKRFQYVVNIVRPREETSKDIGEELKDLLWEFEGVENTKLVRWSRY